DRRDLSRAGLAAAPLRAGLGGEARPGHARRARAVLERPLLRGAHAVPRAVARRRARRLPHHSRVPPAAARGATAVPTQGALTMTAVPRIQPATSPGLHDR